MQLLISHQGLPSRPSPPRIPRRGLPPKRRIPNVEKIVAVSSAKGGVGKSTIAGAAPSMLPINPQYLMRRSQPCPAIRAQWPPKRNPGHGYLRSLYPNHNGNA